MQFYASIAHHLERDEPRHPSNVARSALDMKSFAFSTPGEDEEERRGKKGQSWISLHLLLYLWCTGEAVQRLIRAHADADVDVDAKKHHTQTADVNLNNL